MVVGATNRHNVSVHQQTAAAEQRCEEASRKVAAAM
jgi:hypothetical protein